MTKNETDNNATGEKEPECANKLLNPVWMNTIYTCLPFSAYFIMLLKTWVPHFHSAAPHFGEYCSLSKWSHSTCVEMRASVYATANNVIKCQKANGREKKDQIH